MKPVRIQHVSVPRPPGSEETARDFYGGVLGLEELPVPRSIRHLDLIWYSIGEVELHLFAEEPRPDRSGRHFCIEVEDLEAVRSRLLKACCPLEEDPEPIPNRPRFFARDPFGNRIEFTRILGEYLEAEQ